MQSAAGTSFAWAGSVVDDDATENDLFRIQTLYIFNLFSICHSTENHTSTMLNSGFQWKCSRMSRTKRNR